MSKPVLYTFGMSVWAAAGELAVYELGYSDSVDIKVLNLAEGANFDPEFLRINPHGTLPTLVVDGKTYTSTKDVISYLARNAPKKVASSTSLTDKVHEDKYDPNAPMLLSRNEDELNAHRSSFPSVFLQNRQNALDRYSALPEAAPFQDFYQSKKAANGGLLALYKGQVPAEAIKAFYDQSTAHWQSLVTFILEELPAALPDSGFLAGAEPGEDDFHVAAWLARIVSLVGGKNDKEGVKALEKETKQPIPHKVAAYWAAWIERPSFQKVYKGGLH